MFRILIFYKSDEAAERYLNSFRYMPRVEYCTRSHDSTVWRGDGVEIVALKRSVSERARGMVAHIIAVQEELTWCEDWEKIRDCILRPMLATPIDIQIFDGDIRDEQEA